MALLQSNNIQTKLEKLVYSTDFEERVNRAANSFIQHVDLLLEEESYEYRQFSFEKQGFEGWMAA